MINIGKYNLLEVIKTTSIGLYLSDGKEEILLPKRYVPEGISIGKKLKVFVYLDNDNRLIATTKNPISTVGEFSFMAVKEVNRHGAFLDWGIDRDVFVPYEEQSGDLQKGNKCLVYIFIDEISGRIAATQKWFEFVEENTKDLSVGMEVKLLIAQQTDFGFKAIINHKQEGLIYRNEVFEDLALGDIKTGYVKLIREDGKVDLSLQKIGYEHIIDTKQYILNELKINNGILPYGDKSSPEEIYSKFKISKKAFKKTIGGLFKDKLISISDYEVRVVAK